MHCAHVEQAQFFRQVRGTGPHESADDTLEMHISEAELEALLEAPPVHPTEIRANEAVVSPRELRRSQWTMAIAAMAIAGIASALTYSFALRAAPSAKTAPPAPLAIHLAAEPAAAAPAPESPPPVRFANPFDPTEVFEFPAGTPEAEARDEVAEVLLERARHRLSESRDPKHSKI